MNLSNITYNSIVENFINQAIDNQTHPNEFLLVLASGQFDKEIAENEENPLKGYTTGNLFEKFSTRHDDKFLKWYIEESGFILDDQLPTVELDNLDHQVSLKIESMIYLSFWESDITQMLLYQLARLANKERYDWQWRELLGSYSSRSKFFREEIKKRAKKFDSELYDFFDQKVKNQIRNAIAHSQFAPLINNIKLLNYQRDQYSMICLIDYEEWESLICATLAFRQSLFMGLNEHLKMALAQFPTGKFTVELATEHEGERGLFSFL